ncbi:hypothetical protein Tco_0396079 [Tanacetum coccineum]
MSKNDMKSCVSTLSESDLEDLVKTFCIPMDLHPRFPDSSFTMDCLPSDAIGIYSEFLLFFGVPNGYDRNDVERIRIHLIRLREIREEVLVCSGLSFVWFDKECDLISIYDFMTLPSWGDAKIVEEPHHLFKPLLERVPSHTTAPAIEDAIIPLPTPDEVAVAQPDLRLARKSKGSSHVRIRSAPASVSEPSQPSKKRRLKKRASKAGSSAPELRQAKGLNEADMTDFCVELEDRMDRDEGTSIRAASVPMQCLGVALLLEGMLSVVLLGSLEIPLDALARSALSHDAKYDEIPKDDFGTTTRGDEIELTLFPLALGFYHMPYLYESVSSPLYTKEEWDGPHAPEREQRFVFLKRAASEEALTVRDLQNELALERLLSSDKFHAALAHVASLGINYGVERGLHMGRTDADFEIATKKVSNIQVGTKADFDKALVDFPTTPFSFLGKVDVAARGMTTSVPYARINGVSSLLVLGVVL